MQFAHAAWIDDEQRAGHGRGDRELGHRDDAHGAAVENFRRLGEQTIAMGERRLVERARRRDRAATAAAPVPWRCRPPLGEIGEGRSRHAEIPGEHLRRRMAEPVGDARRCRTRRNSRCRRRARRCRRRDRSLESNGHDRAGNTRRRRGRNRRSRPGPCGSMVVTRQLPVDHIGPFGGVGVPVQLAQAAGLERHIDPGKLVGDRELGDRRFLGGAAVARSWAWRR